MYEVDARDVVVRLKTLPPCDVGAPMPALVATEQQLEVGDVGAPMPALVATEQQLEVAYIARAETTAHETIVVATFDRPYAHMFGLLGLAEQLS